MVALMHLYVEGFPNRRLWFMGSLTFYYFEKSCKRLRFLLELSCCMCCIYSSYSIIIIHLFELIAHEHN